MMLNTVVSHAIKKVSLIKFIQEFIAVVRDACMCCLHYDPEQTIKVKEMACH